MFNDWAINFSVSPPLPISLDTPMVHLEPASRWLKMPTWLALLECNRAGTVTAVSLAKAMTTLKSPA